MNPKYWEDLEILATHACAAFNYVEDWGLRLLVHTREDLISACGDLLSVLEIVRLYYWAVGLWEDAFVVAKSSCNAKMRHWKHRHQSKVSTSHSLRKLPRKYVCGY